MHSQDILIDAFGRIREEVHAVVEGLAPEDLDARPGGTANSISWLVWHLTRIQDDHVADAAGTPQVWLSGDWSERFALDLPPRDTGYGHTTDRVARVRGVSGELLAGYHDAVRDRTLAFLGTLTGEDLDRVVDDRWDPAVTLGVRLVSVLSDDLQHVGQAAYVRGLLQRA
ncbi:DinB family protein [Streptomyces sp. NPDC048566]|uniref:mycothiol transferase n=1 Tax=Streptomyces sp. NPDC048566 TaxID=3365569 RepID=UPI00371B2D57